jgi:hypothetical protein
MQQSQYRLIFNMISNNIEPVDCGGTPGSHAKGEVTDTVATIAELGYKQPQKAPQERHLGVESNRSVSNFKNPPSF